MPLSTDGLSAALKRLVGPVYVPVFFVSRAWAGVTPALPAYLTGLGAGLAFVGVVVSMRGVGQVVSDLPGGMIISRFGLERVVTLSYILSIVANSGLIVARSLPVITLLVFLSGLFSSILITGIMTYVRLTVPALIRGRALSLVGGSLRVGALVGPVIGGLLADTLGMGWVFGLRTTAQIVGLISFAATVGRHEDVRATSQSVRVQSQALFAGIADRIPALLSVGFAILILSLLRASRSIVLPLWGEHLGMSATIIGVVMSIGAAFEIGRASCRERVSFTV